MADFEYYYGLEAEQFNFFRLPKRLVRDRLFQAISSDAKILYGVLMDRMTLSAKNGWVDSENRVYIIFSVTDVMEEFGCSKRKAIMLLNELDTTHGIGLIEKKRQGLGKPNLIYVKNFNTVESETASGEDNEVIPLIIDTYPEEQEVAGQAEEFENEVLEEEGEVRPVEKCKSVHLQKCKSVHLQKCKSMHLQKCKNVHPQKCKNVHPNNTELSETDCNNYNNLSIHLSDDPGSSIPLLETGWMDRETVIELFKSKLEYDALCKDHPQCQGRIEELFGLLADTYSCAGDTVAIGGCMLPIQEVRERFMHLTVEHMRYVLYSLEQNTTKIKNIRAYLLTCLYNAPLTMQSFYHAMVKHDYG